MKISAGQMRAARGLLDWSGPKLAEASGLSLHTIRRMETLGPERSTAANVQAARRALEDAGIVFEAEDDFLGAGVRLKK
ncbi:transcriptional regulator [Caulobacter sp. CCH9-E1]|uniref:helix-turn-helix domain-containing protein n=1 Tax=Caulobacter sp. CCH9-E1 TaxID=1768768 RepID=UPI001E4DA065|nr:transcriptional regulator [Caulobacter sp. CCH9-E1]